MRSKGTIFLLLTLIVFCLGCETLKGAKEGFKRDWASWTKADEKLQEKMW